MNIIEELQKKAAQRAALAGVILGIMKCDVDIDINRVKTTIAVTLSEMVELDLMVGDEVDIMMFSAMKEHIDGEIAIDDANKIIGEES
jgi:hypothetical protein